MVSTWEEVHEKQWYPSDFTVTIAELLLPLLPPSPLTLLDYGCAGGELVQMCVDAGYDAVGQDISPAAIARAQDRFPDRNFRVGEEVDGTFDVTIASLVYPYNPMPDTLNHVLSHTNLEHFAIVIKDVAGAAGFGDLDCQFFNEEDMTPPEGWYFDFGYFRFPPHAYLARYYR